MSAYLENINISRGHALASTALVLSVLAILFAVSMRATPCVSAASGSCSVGETETFAGTLGLGKDADIEYEGATENDFETTLAVTDPTADRTITFPDASGTVALAGSAAAHIDQWRLDTSLNGSQDPISTNWERNDTNGFAKIGDGMTESSGVFSFPAVGVWSIRFHLAINADGSAEDAAQGYISTTTDNGASWDDFGWCTLEFNSSGSDQESCMAEAIFDVDDVASEKVRFRALDVYSTNDVVGSSTSNRTSVTFHYIGAN